MCNQGLKIALFLLGLMPSLFYVIPARAQTKSGLSNIIQDSGLIFPGHLENIQPVRQQNFLIDSSSSSQQFFRDGRNSLYLLPAESVKPILKIDESSGIQEVDRKESNDVDEEKQ